MNIEIGHKQQKKKVLLNNQFSFLSFLIFLIKKKTKKKLNRLKQQQLFNFNF
jgi:hypothetical protein